MNKTARSVGLVALTMTLAFGSSFISQAQRAEAAQLLTKTKGALIVQEAPRETALSAVLPVTEANVAPGCATTMPRTTFQVPVTTTFEATTVHTSILNKPKAALEVYPLTGTRLDTIKLSIGNRINSGLVSGKLTDEEAGTLRQAMENLAVQEAQFKLSGPGLSDGEIANMQRKFHALALQISDLEDNGAINQLMPSVDSRLHSLQRRISYNLAAHNLTLAEAEQLYALLNNVQDLKASARATGETLTADEQEALHRDLMMIDRKLSDRAGGMIIVTANDIQLRKNELVALINRGICEKKLTPMEITMLRREYDRIAILSQNAIADGGLQSRELAALTKQVENLNFILRQELDTRTPSAMVAGSPAPQL